MAIQFAPLLTVAATPLAPAAQPGAHTFPALQAALPVVAAPAETPQNAAVATATATTASLADSASMRPDQLFMARQLAWPAFDGAALAAAWRGMVSTYGLQLAAMQQQAAGHHVPGVLLMSGQFAATQQAAQQPALQWHPDAWRFVTPGPARPMTLRVLAGGPDQPPGRRRRGKAALRVELTLEDGMRATVQLEALPEGVMMELAAPYTGSLELLRAALPGMREAIARAGFTLVRTTLRHALAPARPVNDSPSASSLPAPLFRAMADVALLLAMPAEAAGDDPA
ncbi:hypothetical protein HHL21_20045 [Massilia sp. RP-1-19]|uniref:Flagellar hook-length control protein FliK n=1 Tax=Massilia polaris TaxID=2728846 RepID=A0A848HX56_9BURK|nr:hypothetical protein [Massilia polaris]NML63338.1 hypothetical protein [Massilia polaris]